MRNWIRTPAGKRAALVVVLAGALLGGFGVWVLLHPASAFVQPWRTEQRTSEQGVVFGPYPVEEDFVALKAKGVSTIISLLNPDVPYERVLLAQERERAARHGMEVKNFPMGSILGQTFGADYDRNSRAAAHAALDAEGTAYIHCYLGLHRAKNVQRYLDQFGKSSTYVGVQSEDPAHVAAKERAQQAYDRGDMAAALATLAAIPDKGVRAQRLEAWALYRLQRFDEAEAAFGKALALAPGDVDSLVGIAYAGMSLGRLEEAATRFDAVLARKPDEPAAVEGLGHVRFRQSRWPEARRLFERARVLNPRNLEVAQMLERLPVEGAALQ